MEQTPANYEGTAVTLETNDSLPVLPLNERQHLRQLAPTEAAKRYADQCFQAREYVETGGNYNNTNADPSNVRIAAWNMQQGHFIDESVALLRCIQADIILLTEVDVGMARTHQRHTAKVVADQLTQGYVFTAEFLELMSSSPPSIMPQSVEENDFGYHGNAILSSDRPLHTDTVLLDEVADWFINPRRNLRRIGQRVAIMSRIPIGPVNLTVISVHLESDCGIEGRASQMATLLRRVDTFAGDGPIVIGGDFNAGATLDDFDHSKEELFTIAERFGFDWQYANTTNPTSRISRMTNAVQQNKARFDWFFVRKVDVVSMSNVAAVDSEDQAISDHDVIVIDVCLDRDCPRAPDRTIG